MWNEHTERKGRRPEVDGPSGFLPKDLGLSTETPLWGLGRKTATQLLTDDSGDDEADQSGPFTRISRTLHTHERTCPGGNPPAGGESALIRLIRDRAADHHPTLATPGPLSPNES